jgi:hypothetical protein
MPGLHTRMGTGAVAEADTMGVAGITAVTAGAGTMAVITAGTTMAVIIIPAWAFMASADSIRVGDMADTA